MYFSRIIKDMKYGESIQIDNAKLREVYPGFRSWQPSTWPDLSGDSANLPLVLESIVKETIAAEIGNVINDALLVNSGLTHRGHVVAISLFCAIDAISSYAFLSKESQGCEQCGRGDKVGPRYEKFIQEFFPDSYKPHASSLYKSYRNSLVHSWNLFEVAMVPGNEEIKEVGGILHFGLLNFYDALCLSCNNLINSLDENKEVRENCLNRYTRLRSTAK